MKISRFPLFLVASTSIFALLTVTSCKKSNNNSSSGGVSATVSGTAFSPNVTTGIYGTSEASWVISGFSMKSNDTSIIVIGIYKSFSWSEPQFIVGKPFTTDTTSASVDYFVNGLNGKDYDASNGDGFATFTVTSLDTTGHKIAGTFSGTLYASPTDSVVITNGSFNTPYTVEP